MKQATKAGRPYNAAIASAQRWATRLHSAVFRATNGKVGGRMLGSPVLLLVTKGRKTGRPRTAPLLYLKDGNRYAIVASNGGTREPSGLVAEPAGRPRGDRRGRGPEGPRAGQGDRGRRAGTPLEGPRPNVPSLRRLPAKDGPPNTRGPIGTRVMG